MRLNSEEPSSTNDSSFFVGDPGGGDEVEDMDSLYIRDLEDDMEDMDQYLCKLNEIEILINK